MSAGMPTKGPWREAVGPYENGVYGVDRVDGSKQLVAEVYGYSHEEKNANRRLIAAAPTMLDALKGLLPILEAVRYTAGLSGTQIKRMEAAKAALAAATQADAGEGR